jgi:hypothetical protein
MIEMIRKMIAYLSMTALQPIPALNGEGAGTFPA